MSLPPFSLWVSCLYTVFPYSLDSSKQESTICDRRMVYLVSYLTFLYLHIFHWQFLYTLDDASILLIISLSIGEGMSSYSVEEMMCSIIICTYGLSSLWDFALLCFPLEGQLSQSESQQRVSTYKESYFFRTFKSATVQSMTRET